MFCSAAAGFSAKRGETSSGNAKNSLFMQLQKVHVHLIIKNNLLHLLLQSD